MVHEARTPSELLLLLIADLSEWPMGFFRSELRIAMTRRLAELSAQKTTVPAGAAKTTPNNEFIETAIEREEMPRP